MSLVDTEMTATDVTGFYVFFLRPEIGQFSPHFGATSLLDDTENLEKRKNPEKIPKIQWRRRPNIAETGQK